MPFTPTHILAVLPLWPARQWLPFSALAIGTMMPDVALLFPLVDYAQTHSPIGLFTVCLPLGVVGFLVFEMVMRGPLIALLPSWAQSRLRSSPQVPKDARLHVCLNYFAGVSLAVVIGAYTHQVWDAFTHQGRWGTQLFPSLNSEFHFWGHPIPGYKLLQYGSTIVGLPLLAILTLAALNRLIPHDIETSAISGRLKVLAGLMLVVMPLVLCTYSLFTEPTIRQALGMAARQSARTLLLASVTYSIVFQTRMLSKP